MSALAQLGESLVVATPGWRIVRLAPESRSEHRPELANVERELESLGEAAVEIALIIAVGRLVRVGGEVALSARGSSDAEDARRGDGALPLGSIRERLRGMRARRVCVLAGWPDPDEGARAGSEGGDTADLVFARECVAALVTGRGDELIAVGTGLHAQRTIEALRDALVGEAVDERTGTITLQSLAEHLAREVPGIALQLPSDDRLTDTIATPAPLTSQWDPRLTRRARKPAPAASSPDRSGPESLVGTILPGRFRIDSVIARGGFGSVYRAHQLSVGRDVALKVMHGSVDAASPAGRLFVQEIQGVGRIDHPNVVRIYQADVTPAGNLFFAMELLAGRDLEQVIREEGRLELARVVAIGEQLLAGLGAAHDAGLIHADLKPANLLLVPGRTGERVVLVDFGLSRLRSPEAPARSVGGTPAYMAPEQLRNGRVDARSDLFAAALVMITLLTGWRRRSSDELVPPLDDIPDRRLRDVLARALALRPADRFATAVELASTLRGGARAEDRPSAPRGATSPSFLEVSRERLYGRDRELEVLAGHVLDRRAVVLDGDAGAGKTTLLRRGLYPRLRAQGAHVVYVAALTGDPATTERTLAQAIDPATRDVATAVERWVSRSGGRLVLIVDQLDALDEGARRLEEVVRGMLDVDRWPAMAEIAVVLGVRTPGAAAVCAGIAEAAAVTLGLLDEDGAREAIIGPLAELRLSVDDELLVLLLRDLARAAPVGPAGEAVAKRRGIYPPHLQHACAALVEAMLPDEARLTCSHYERAGGAAIFGRPASSVAELPASIAASEGGARASARPGQRSIRRRIAIGTALLAGGAIVVALGFGLGLGLRDPAPPVPPTITVGGTGVVLFSVIEPLHAFLEERTGAVLPIETKFDLGSGGAIRSLASREIDVAAVSRRLHEPAPRELRSAGMLLVEVPIGYDESALFVHRRNPLHRIDLAAIRAHLCCGPGERLGAVTWGQLGSSMPGLANREVAWTLFGRTVEDPAGGSMSSTLRTADEWLCAPRQLCPSKVSVSDTAADEILAEHATGPEFLALSNQAFATRDVAPLVIVDDSRGVRLDGRRVLWLYHPVPRGRALAAPICALFRALLEDSVAARLPNIAVLPAAARRRQRQALDLDDDTCGLRPIFEAPTAESNDDGIVRSPIGAEVEISERWVPDR